MKFIRYLLLLVAFIAFIPILSQGAESPPPSSESPADEPALIEAAQKMRRAGVVQFNFSNVEIVKFIRFMSELLQENIIVPPGLTAKVTLVSPKPVPLSESKQLMLSALSMNGLSIQSMGSYSRIVAAPGPVLIEGEIRKGKEGPGVGEQNVTQVVPLTYVTAEYVVQAIQQSVGQSVMVMPVGVGREVLLGGRATEVNRAINLIRRLDVASSVKASKAFPVKFSEPATVAAQLNELSKAGYLTGLVAMPDPSSRKVLVVGEPDIIARAAKVISELDVDMRDGDFHIYKLKHIGAKAAAEQIGHVLAASAKMQPAADAAAPSIVVPDLTTNSLIFSASRKQYESLVKILDEIDKQPKQVLLRGLIAEVNLSNLDRAGVDWSTFGGQIFGDAVIASQMSLGGSSVPATFLEWFRDIANTTEEYYDAHGNIRTRTVTKAMGLVYAYVDLLKQFDAINVLSMPRIMCLDNQQSSFQIGDVIPVLKGTASDLVNPNAIQSNYDYKPTGITLTVTPQIRSGNLVALDIVQTTEDVKSSGVTPTTLKREIKTSVIVANGDTIVLGGLVREAETTLRQKVPGFSYIPLIGGLFSKKVKQHQKIDFMMFLTPYIIESPEQIAPVTKGIVLSGDMGLSEAEKAVQKRLEEIFRKSQKK